jgi:cytidine deaminase
MTTDVDELFAAAREVQTKAHAPYSNFQVGAAVRTASGEIFAGCNVENAAYPQGSCAEAGAISAMVAAGERQIVAVLTICDGEAIGTCCGGCRQRLREFAAGNTPTHNGPDGWGHVHVGRAPASFVRSGALDRVPTMRIAGT